LPIDENVKENIKDLRFNQHKTIREIAEITGKSSRDIIAVLNESEDKEIIEEENKNVQGKVGNTEQDPPLNIKAYKLFSEGKSLVDVTVALKLTTQQAHQFRIDFWKLMQMHQLFVIYQENKDSIGYFLKLVRLGKKEGMTPEQIIYLLKMADNTKDLRSTDNE
jgi:hypothetical protein